MTANALIRLENCLAATSQDLWAVFRFSYFINHNPYAGWSPAGILLILQ